METKTVPASVSSTVLNKDAVLTSIEPEETIRDELLFLISSHNSKLQTGQR